MADSLDIEKQVQSYLVPSSQPPPIVMSHTMMAQCQNQDLATSQCSRHMCGYVASPQQAKYEQSCRQRDLSLSTPM
jgi:hypothetical protein